MTTTMAAAATTTTTEPRVCPPFRPCRVSRKRRVAGPGGGRRRGRRTGILRARRPREPAHGGHRQQPCRGQHDLDGDLDEPVVELPFGRRLEIAKQHQREGIEVALADLDRRDHQKQRQGDARDGSPCCNIRRHMVGAAAVPLISPRRSARRSRETVKHEQSVSGSPFPQSASGSRVRQARGAVPGPAGRDTAGGGTRRGRAAFPARPPSGAPRPGSEVRSHRRAAGGAT